MTEDEDGQSATVHTLITSTEALYQIFIPITSMNVVEQADALDKLTVKGMSKAQVKAEFKNFTTGVKKMMAQQAEDEAKLEGLRQWMLDTFYQIESEEGHVRVARVRQLEASGVLPARNRLDRQSYRDFRDAIAHLPDLGEDMTAANWWQRSKEKKIAYGATLDDTVPGGALVNGYVNLWWGFSVEPAEPAGPEYVAFVKAFLRHMWSLCGGSDTIEFRYLLRWLAWCVQNPTLPIGTAVVLRSEPGTGKGLLFSTMCGIFGAHGRRVNRRDDIVGRFNHLLEGAGFVALEEATWAGAKSDAERLKSMITDPTISIERKYVGTNEVPNIAKFISATNADWAVAVDPNDRRWAVIDCPEPTLAQAEFTEHAARVRDPAYLAAVLTFLKSIDLSEWSAEQDRPQTAAYTDQKAASLHADTLWWRLVIDQQTWAVAGKAVISPVAPGEPLWVRKADVYGMYVAWHYATHQKGSPTIVPHFWRSVRKWFPEQDFDKQDWSGEHRGLRLIRIPSDLGALGEPFYGWLHRVSKARKDDPD